MRALRWLETPAERRSTLLINWTLLVQAKQQIRVDTDEDRLVSQVALQYTRLMVLNLTNNINKFK